MPHYYRMSKVHTALSRASLLALGPLLLAQGLYVRRVTPRLPEPPGAREGVAGSAHLPRLRVLIVGDSAAAGVGASTQAQALSGQLVALLANDFRVHWKLCAQTGLTSAQLVTHLAQVPADQFDLAVVSVGVNDVTAGIKPRQWHQRLDALTELLRERFSVRQILLSPLPPMHRFTALPQPLRWYLGLQAQRLNQGLQRYVQASAHCAPVALDYPLEQSVDKAMLAADGFHPGERAYAHWAGQVAQAVRKSQSL